MHFHIYKYPVFIGLGLKYPELLSGRTDKASGYFNDRPMGQHFQGDGGIKAIGGGGGGLVLATRINNITCNEEETTRNNI